MSGLLRTLAAAATVAAAVLPLGAVACDQASLRLVVPFTPGASADNIARALADQLGRQIGKAVLVDNKPGGGQIVGAQAIVQSPPNGCTLGMITSAVSLNPALHAKLPYDSFNDIDPIIRLVDLDLGIFVKPDSPIKSVAQLKGSSGGGSGLTFGTPGSGSMPHLAGGLIGTALPADLIHVAYKGLAPAKLDLLAGRLDMTIGAVSTELNSVKSGELRAVAVLSSQRLKSLPDVPAVAETVPGTVVSDYFGIALRSGTPEPVRANLYKEIAQALASPAVGTLLGRLGLAPAADTPGALRQRVADDAKWMAELVKSTGIKVD